MLYIKYRLSYIVDRLIFVMFFNTLFCYYSFLWFVANGTLLIAMCIIGFKLINSSDLYKSLMSQYDWYRGWWLKNKSGIK